MLNATSVFVVKRKSQSELRRTDLVQKRICVGKVFELKTSYFLTLTGEGRMLF